jgi:Ice-binding-like
MRTNRQCFPWLGISILGMLILSPALMGQASKKSDAALPATTDWSQYHLIFSKPAAEQQAKWVEREPRYWQQLRSQSPARPSEAEIGSGQASRLQTRARFLIRDRKHSLEGDWSEDMGGGATVGAVNYPAKYSFDIRAADCSNDFVVYGTGLAGSGSQAGIVAFNNLYSGCIDLVLGTAANFAILGSATVTNAGDTVVTGANIGISPGASLTGFPPGVLTPPAAQYLGDSVASQAHADANTAYTRYQGLTGATDLGPTLDGLTLAPGLYKVGTSLALSVGATVTLDGDGTYIFQIGSTLNFAGTVVLSGGAKAGNVIWLVGSSATLEGTAVAAGNIVAQASITLDSGASVAGRVIALAGAVTMIDNAVTTVDTVPSVYWAYNTNGGTVTTSPVFSADGAQIAFVQTDSFSNGNLVLLKWAPSNGALGQPRRLSRTRSSAYFVCTAPCMTSFLLRDSVGGLHGDITSSVFYDYGSDTAYVGDAGGWLHKFTPVFKGIPLEVRSGGWPVQVSSASATPLTSPVHDSVSGNVFVADVGGFLYRVSSSTPVLTTASGPLDFSYGEDGGAGIVQGPIVDSTSGLVYVFASSDGSANCAGAACAAVDQLSIDFSAGTAGSKVTVGTSTVFGSAPNPLYIGAFDSTYENSVNATGNLYVCGNTGGAPTLYQVPITAGVFGTALPGAALSITTTPCSPVTDVANPNANGGTAERIFVSEGSEGISSGCSTGCVFSFVDTPWQGSTVYSLGQEVLDSNLRIEVVISVTGPSGLAAPAWNTNTGGSTTDGGVTWLDQGVTSPPVFSGWAAGLHTLGAEIVDPNNNIELVTIAGTSGAKIPTFNTTAGRATFDGTVTWTNVGTIATAALAATGGTSGMIIDNIVGSGMEPGASQIYFSTLSDQTCATSGGTGGCAVQASQSALQ